MSSPYLFCSNIHIYYIFIIGILWESNHVKILWNQNKYKEELLVVDSIKFFSGYRGPSSPLLFGKVNGKETINGHVVTVALHKSYGIPLNKSLIGKQIPIWINEENYRPSNTMVLFRGSNSKAFFRGILNQLLLSFLILNGPLILLILMSISQKRSNKNETT